MTNTKLNEIATKVLEFDPDKTYVIVVKRSSGLAPEDLAKFRLPKDANYKKTIPFFVVDDLDAIELKEKEEVGMSSEALAFIQKQEREKTIEEVARAVSKLTDSGDILGATDEELHIISRIKAYLMSKPSVKRSDTGKV